MDLKDYIYETPPPSEAEIIAKETDEIVHRLLQKSAAHFTVLELGWLLHFHQKLRWSTTADQERALQESVKAVEASVLEREAAAKGE